MGDKYREDNYVSAAASATATLFQLTQNQVHRLPSLINDKFASPLLTRHVTVPVLFEWRLIKNK